MPSRSDVDRLADAGRDLRALVARDLAAFWGTLDLSQPERARDALLAFLPSLVALYGDVAATVAADWYEGVRLAANAPGRFTPSLAPVVGAEVVERRTRYGVRHLFTDSPELALPFLADAMGGYVLQAGRDTILTAASSDRKWKPRVARVPSGAETCAFCLSLASRGAVYATVESAGRFNKYHADCDCQAVPIGKGEPFPDGYDPDALYQQYQAARANTDNPSFKNILSELRQLEDVN